MNPLITLSLIVLTFSCKDQSTDSAVPAAGPTLVPPDPDDGFQFAFSTTVEPYSEAWVCGVYPAPYEALSPVNWVEYEVTPGLHHTTIATPSLFGSVLEAGSYDCKELIDVTMGEDSDYIMAFGLGAGEPTGEIRLPDGVAANLPAGIDIIHEIHFVNPTDQPIEAYSYINAYTLPFDEVEEGIWGGQIRDETISIPPQSEATEWSRCIMNEDVDIHFLASHTHELGTNFTIRTFDGKDVGDVIFSNDDWHDPKITQYDPPLVVPAGTGLEWSCDFYNPTDAEVTYGDGASFEMCNMTLVHTPQSLTAWCDVVETSDGVLWKP